MADITEIRAKYGSIVGAKTLEPEHKLWLPFSSLPLNYQTGGGIPYGVVLEVFGYESSGKSLLALDAAVSTQALGGIVNWADAEMAMEDSREFYEAQGLDFSKLELLEDDTVEVVSDWVREILIYQRSKLKNNEPILFVIDSIAALECEELQEKDQSGGKKQMGNRAKAIYEFYRKNRKLIKKLGAILIVVNQLREKVGASPFEEGFQTPGGKSTAFYASLRILIIKGRKSLHKDIAIGHTSHIHVRKNKTAPIRPKIEAEVFFKDTKLGYVGYSKYAGLSQILKENGLLTKVGGVYTINGKGDLGSKFNKSMDDLFETDKELRQLAIRALKINTRATLRKKLESIATNLYPVPKKYLSTKTKAE